MSGLAKIAVVIAGYAAAVGAGVLAARRTLIAAASLAFAVTGLGPLVSGPPVSSVPLMLLTLLPLAQLLGVPFWLAAFALFVLLAPTRESRRRLLGAVGFELAIAACALVHWFVPRPPF